MQPNLKMLQQMQNRMMKIQEELGQETVEATAGGGAVTVVMTGHQKVQSVKIDPEVLDPEDVEGLEDLLVAAFNEAVTKSQELASKRMAEVTGGIKIPGLM
ncbi:MAG: YbaB/EbfC family nucleoid-associated protein [Chloroflexi bacterium]|nr:YbaB/EbfC family nucleoid-associated protein [Chloroflexota bacterium]